MKLSLKLALPLFSFLGVCISTLPVNANVQLGKSSFVGSTGELRLYSLPGIDRGSRLKYLGVAEDSDYLFTGSARDKSQGDFVETKIPSGKECKGKWSIVALSSVEVRLTQTYTGFYPSEGGGTGCPQAGSISTTDLYIPGYWEAMMP